MTTHALPKKGVTFSTLAYGVCKLVGGAVAEQGMGEVPFGCLGKRGGLEACAPMRSRGGAQRRPPAR